MSPFAFIVLSVAIAAAMRDSEPLEFDQRALQVAVGKSSMVLQRNSGQLKNAANLSQTAAKAQQANGTKIVSNQTEASAASGLNQTVASAASRGAAAEASEETALSSVDIIVSETAKTHHSLAQFLGIEGGSICPTAAVNGSGAKHGCNLGCRCGLLQRCYSKPYSGPVIPGMEDVGFDGVDVGVCRLAFPALMAIFGAVSTTVWLGAHFLRKATAAEVGSDPSGRPNPSRSDLESRLRSATALSDEQRQAILDEFCGKGDEQASRGRRDVPLAFPCASHIFLKPCQVAVSG
jgi:hypothetical protein